MVVDQLAFLDADVADVLHNHRVRDRCANRDAARRVRGLRDAQLGRCSFRRDRCSTICSYRFTVRILTGRRCRVLDRTRIDVLLQYRIRVGDLFLCAGRQIERLRILARQLDQRIA